MIPTVNLDDRTFDDIRDEAIRLIPRYCPEWTNHNASDPGITLIELFSWMTEMTLYRLNKVPQKNYLAMLELMGMSLSPPQGARAIVRFFPIDNCKKNILVKKGTKIASVSEDTQPVIFETEKNLLVRDTKIVSCINRTEERFSECIDDTGRIGEFTLFETQNNIEHTLYISSPVFKYLKEGHSVQISFESAGEIVSVQDEIINHLYFEYWDSRQWREIEGHPSIHGIKKKDNTIFLNGPVEIDVLEILNKTGYFIRAVLSDVPENLRTLVLRSIKIKSIFEGEGFIPDLCVANSGGTYEYVDMNNSFRLFSENPSFNECFYIAADEILKNKKSKVTISFMFSEVYVPESENDNALFAYEYWNGKDWVKLTGERDELIDGTFGFRQGGTVSFKIPKDMTSVSVNNDEHLYIRIRLITKDFSIGGVYVQNEKGVYQWQFNSKVQSPILNKIRITYDAPMQNPESVISNSCFLWNKIDGLSANNSGKNEFTIFNIDKEHLPSLYIGFGSKIKDGEFPVYFNIDDADTVKKLKRDDIDFIIGGKEPASVQNRMVCITWEFWDGSGWKKLGFSDFTDCFHESGFINFNIPDSICENTLFSKKCYWLRAVKINGSFEKVPVIKDIVINSVYSVNADTYRNEIIGSGNGAPGQIFRVSHPNLLPGLSLSVNEGAIPSGNEIEKMKKDGIEEPYEVNDKQVWVKYKEVHNFYNSGPFSRHFVVNYSTGQILFGDGVHGVNPSKGKFNIRVNEYKVGGGGNGNIAAHKLQFLTQSIPYIAGCDNPFAAEGGCDMETVESLKARSAGIFKSLNRAVTREDFEWLSCEASSSVGRAYCLKDKTSDGKVRTIIIPEMTSGMGYGEKLVPSKELLRRVKNYLDERKLVGTEILISGPVYRSFRIKVEVIFKNNVFNFDNEKNKIKEHLEVFFHPLIGYNGKGYEFGKTVTKGLILKVLGKNQGILSVGKIEIFDEDAGVAVEYLLSKNDELPYLSDVLVVDRRG